MTAIRENFVGSDGALGQQLTWVSVVAGLTNVSNQANVSTGNTQAYARCSSDLSTDVHECLVMIFSLSTSGSINDQCGPCVRYNSSADTCYYARLIYDGSTKVVRITKRVAGSDSDLGSDATVTFTVPATLKLRVETSGSDAVLTAFVNGVQVKQETDASSPITANTRCGLYGYHGSAGTGTVAMAQWRASDYAAVTPTFDITTPPIRYASNPVVTHNSGAWNATQPYDPRIIVDPSNSANLLMYASGQATGGGSGIQSIGLYHGTVADPYTWTEEGGAGNGQILAGTGGGGDFDENQVRIGEVIYNADTDEIWLYYTGYVTPGSDGSIGLAIAPAATPASFTRYGSNPIIAPTGSEIAVDSFSVIREYDDWYGIYNYRHSGDTIPRQYRGAYSADGQNWTKLGTNDLLGTKPDTVAFDGPEAHQLIFIDDKYYLILESGSSTNAYAVYAATADFPLGPFRTVATPLPIIGPSGATSAFDQYAVATPYLIKIGGTWRLYYTGSSSASFYPGPWDIGIADLTGELNTAVNDSFTDTNSTALTSHTPETGPSWEAITGTFQIQSNAVEPNSNADGDIAAIDAGYADVVVTMPMTPRVSGANESTAGVILRLSDATHNWLVNCSAAGSLIQIFENAGSGYSSKASVAYTFSDNTPVTLKVSCIGATITVFVDDVEKLIYTGMQSNITATKFGLRLTKGGTPAGPVSVASFLAENVQSAVRTAAGAVTTTNATAAGTATFAGGTHTASSAVSCSAATVSGSATFAGGTHSAASAVSCSGATASGTATFAGGTHTAAASVTTTQATASGSANFGSAVRTAAAAVTTTVATAAGAATFAGGTHTAAGSVTTTTATASGSATFSFTGRVAAAAVASQPATASGSATFAPGTHTATLAVAVSRAIAAASALFAGSGAAVAKFPSGGTLLRRGLRGTLHRA